MAEWITQIDHQILLFIQEHLRFDWMTDPSVFISHLGHGAKIWILLCILLLFFKSTRKMGICGIVGLLFSGLIVNVFLKNYVARIRPYEQFQDIILLLEAQKDFSFPSGHASSSFAVAVAIWKMCDHKQRWIGILSMILAVLIAWSRLYVGVHFPSDVICGIIIGILCACIAVHLVQWWLNRKSGEVYVK